MSSIAEERASFARDIEYLQSMSKDDDMQNSLYAVEKKLFGRSSTSDDESLYEEAVDAIPDEDNFSDDEIQRIVNSDKNMDIDDIMGIPEEDEEEIKDDEDINMDDMLDLAEDEFDDF